ncbi:unnamed protein product [Leuciscus chuanchicus]
MAEDANLGAEMEVETVKEKRNFSDTHSYACKVKNGGSCDSCPNTPSKNQPSKRHKNVVASAAKESKLSLSEVQENIIRILSEKINERSDQIERMVKENSSNIEALGKSLTTESSLAGCGGARKEGKSAYFSGARAFVDGKEIHPEEGNGTS